MGTITETTVPRALPARPRRRAMTRTQPVLVGVGLLLACLATLAVTASPAYASATPYQRFSDSVDHSESSRSQSPSGVIESLHAGGVFANQERGFHLGMTIGGFHDFTFGFDHLHFWQDRGSSDPSMFKTRLNFGINFLEIYPMAYLRFELSAVFGQDLIGNNGYFNAGLGAFLTLPIWYGPDGWPVMRLSGGYSTDPILNFDDGWRAEGFLSIYPFIGTPIRGFGLHLGVMYGEDRDVAYNMLYAGIIYGAPL